MVSQDSAAGATAPNNATATKSRHLVDGILDSVNSAALKGSVELVFFPGLKSHHEHDDKRLTW